MYLCRVSGMAKGVSRLGLGAILDANFGCGLSVDFRRLAGAYSQRWTIHFCDTDKKIHPKKICVSRFALKTRRQLDLLF